MDYHRWIERERRLRVKLLMQSPEIARKGVFRVCRDCDEVCLCHEAACPNCGGSAIEETPVEREEVARGLRIRCRLRFSKIEGQGD